MNKNFERICDQLDRTNCFLFGLQSMIGGITLSERLGLGDGSGPVNYVALCEEMHRMIDSYTEEIQTEFDYFRKLSKGENHE